MSNPPRRGRTEQPTSGPVPPTPGTNPPRSAQPSTGSGKRVPVGGTPQTNADLATRLDGQRGWLNEIDRSLKKRSIIALVLTCLAVGVGAAAIYISVSKNSDADRISALETRIEALEAAGAANGIAPSTTPLPTTPAE
jgi:hypothetical protein